RTAIAPGRQEQHGHVLDRTGEHGAGKDPQRARQIAHLGGKHWADQRTGPCDRREVMSVEYVSVGRDVIETVVMTNGGRRSRAIAAARPGGDEQAVEPGGYEVKPNPRAH